MRRYQPVAVVHFAAETHVDRSIDSPDVFMRTNVMGTSELLESTRIYWNRLSTEKQRAFRFVHISSDKVYGSLTHGDDPSDENSAYRPSSPYAASKAASNHLIRSYVQTYGLPLLTQSTAQKFSAPISIRKH
jgi:dTDP-glucose 4,6-dehydratase